MNTNFYCKKRSFLRNHATLFGRTAIIRHTITEKYKEYGLIPRGVSPLQYNGTTCNCCNFASNNDDCMKWNKIVGCCFLRNSPQWTMASSFTRFRAHTQRRTTVGRTPLDEWSARHRDLYLTTHNTRNRQTSVTPAGFEPTISAGELPQTFARPLGPAVEWQHCRKITL